MKREKLVSTRITQTDKDDLEAYGLKYERKVSWLVGKAVTKYLDEVVRAETGDEQDAQHDSEDTGSSE